MVVHTLAWTHINTEWHADVKRSKLFSTTGDNVDDYKLQIPAARSTVGDFS